MTRASNTSKLLLVAAIASINPPMNSMIMGSAKQCMMDLYFTVCPSSSVGIPCTNSHKLLSETVSRSSTTIKTDVVHAGTASKTHISVAKMKIEISLCSIIVRLLMPNASVGSNHRVRDMVIAITSFIHRATAWLSANRLAFFKS